MASKTNRYPTRGAVARDYRRDRPTKYTPDNDNRPRPKPRPKPWIPVNDNRPVPKVTDWSVAPYPKIPGWARWARRALRLAGPLGLALTLWDLWDLYNWLRQQEGWDPAPGDGYRWCSDRDSGTWPMGPSVRFGTQNLSCTEGLGYGATVPSWEPGRPWLWTGQQRVVSGRMRTKPMEGFYYPSDPGVVPEWKPGRLEPLPPPDLEPDLRPPPWLDPWREPLRPDPKYPPRPRTRPDPRPERPRLPEDRVDEEPTNEDPTFRPKPPDPRPRPRRPRKDERERKIRIEDMPNKRLRRILGWILSAASEGGDFLEALYDALPDHLQHKDDTLAQKFDKVFRNLDEVDFTEAVNNIWTNQVEDRYFGKGFGDMSDALEEFGIELPTLKL